MSEFTKEIKLRKLIAHWIPSGKERVSNLRLSPHVIPLDDALRLALEERLVSTLGNDSKHLRMCFEHSDSASAFPLLKYAIYAPLNDEKAFIEASQQLASRLNNSTSNPKTPASLLLVIQATTGSGAEAHRTLYIVKAEPHDGFKTKTLDDGTLTIELITDLFLSKSQKMFKAAAFAVSSIIEKTDADSAKFKCVLFDESLTIGNANSLAKYFSNKFLGLAVPNDSDAITQRFFDCTKDYANHQPGLNAEDRYRIITGLHAELNSNRGVIDPIQFGDDYIPDRHREGFLNVIQEAAIPSNSFAKDLRYIRKKVVKRVIEFTNGVSIKTELEKGIDDLIEIIDYGQESDGFTLVKIKANIKSS